MEFLNEEGKKLRKKDSVIYYKSNKELIKIPDITDDPVKVKKFVKLCISYLHKDADDIVDEIWEDYMKKKPGLLETIEIKRKEFADEKWKAISYYKAYNIIDNFELPIVSGKQMMKLKGIGEGIGKTIDDYLINGIPKPANKFDFESDVF